MRFTDEQLLNAAIRAYRNSLVDAGISETEQRVIIVIEDKTYNRFQITATYYSEFYHCDIDIKAHMQIFYTEYRKRIIIDIYSTLGDQDMYLYEINDETGDIIDADTGEIRATIK